MAIPQKAFWLNWRTGDLFGVPTTHDDWLLDPTNLRRAKVAPAHQDAIERLINDDSRSRSSKIDEIRMIGLRAGLVRIRDYLNRLSIQFDTRRGNQTRDCLWAIEFALPRITKAKDHYLTLHNLHNNSSARIYASEFSQRLHQNEQIMESCQDETYRLDVPYSQSLIESVNELLGPPTR